MRIEIGNALSHSNTDDTLSLVLSILAIVISAIVGYFEYSGNRTSSLLDLDSQFFRDIYSGYLLIKLPSALQDISFLEYRICGSEPLEACLTKMRHDSLYYKYTNPEFYEELKRNMMALEDYVVNAHNRTFDHEQQNDFHSAMQDKLKTIYTTINKSYHGKSFKRNKLTRIFQKNP